MFSRCWANTNKCKMSSRNKKKGQIWAEREGPLWVCSTFMHYSTKALFILVPMRMKTALVDWDVIVFLSFRGGESHFSGRRGHFCLAESKHKAAQISLLIHIHAKHVWHFPLNHTSAFASIQLWRKFPSIMEGCWQVQAQTSENKQTPRWNVKTNKDTFL